MNSSTFESLLKRDLILHFKQIHIYIYLGYCADWYSNSLSSLQDNKMYSCLIKAQYKIQSILFTLRTNTSRKNNREVWFLVPH